MTSIIRQAAMALALIPLTALADGWQNLDTVDAAIASTVSAGQSAKPVDRRLKLASCPENIAIEHSAAGILTVRCVSVGWRLRVLLNLAGAQADGRGGANGPIVVRRGDTVSVMTVADRFTIASAGIADSDGRVGDRLKVKMSPTSPAIIGELIDPGTVKIF